MKNIRRLSVISLTLLICFSVVPVAFAHPLGNFTINQYAGLHVRGDSISIDYVLDMAEIPAFQEIATFDANENGQADAAEAAGYHAQKCGSLIRDLDLRLNHQAVPLTRTSSHGFFHANEDMARYGSGARQLKTQAVNLDDSLCSYQTARPDHLT